MNKFTNEGKKLHNVYRKINSWTEKDFHKNMKRKINSIKEYLRVENKHDFLHELILLYSNANANMINIGEITSMENWQKAGYTFLAGFHGIE